MTDRPLPVKELRPDALRLIAAAQPLLIVPSGTCEAHGPHLPVGGDTFVLERLADDLSAEFRALRAPTIEYGVNEPLQLLVPGSATVRRKTLRRWINDLIPDWERLGITDILILTMNGYTPHQEALGTVVADRARVRLLDILAVDFTGLAEHPEEPIHGGEVDTSLVMFVRPDLVDLTRAADSILPDHMLRRYRRGSTMALPVDSPGSVGQPLSASAEKGRRLYEHILDLIRVRVFGANPRGRTG